jgi:formate hydrogenlyase subunit 6/NADH:ubiquinone oxidoreductase subunit I
MNLVSIEIQGKPCDVPEGVTAIQALWHAGYEMVKGIGCLGGVCGACTFTYRRQGESGVKTGLACQTLIESGMSFSPPVSIVAEGARYRVQDIQDPQAGLIQYYPETRRCTRCNACTEICPQAIDVRGCVVKALSGEFSSVSELFYNCVMCGLCTVVCDVGIKPNLVSLYARRSQGAHLQMPPERLLKRLQEIESGAYASQWQEILQSDWESPQSQKTNI